MLDFPSYLSPEGALDDVKMALYEFLTNAGFAATLGRRSRTAVIQDQDRFSIHVDLGSDAYATVYVGFQGERTLACITIIGISQHPMNGTIRDFEFADPKCFEQIAELLRLAVQQMPLLERSGDGPR